MVLVALVAGAIAAALALLITGGGQAQADEVRFQNVSDVGPDPFTEPAESAGRGEGSTSDGGGSENGPSDGQGETSAPEDGGEESAEPGTFGGTGSNRACDREKLVPELTADPDKLREWADVVGVEADEKAVSDYIRQLRPVELTQDTQVTNHRYSGGSAEPYQSIMEKGTAVLVDKDGKPVTRCRCGNPLSEPVELEEETKCIDCPPNYEPPPACDYYDYPDDQYQRYDDQDFERQYRPSEYRGKCYKPEPPPVKKEEPPPDVEPTAEECENDPTAPGCEQQCEQDPTLPHCEGQAPQGYDQAPAEGEEQAPDAQEAPPDGGGAQPDGGETRPTGE